MIVRFNFITMFNTCYTLISNVIWVRVTEHKIMIECQDGRNFTYRIKDVSDFEVIYS